VQQPAVPPWGWEICSLWTFWLEPGEKNNEWSCTDYAVLDAGSGAKDCYFFVVLTPVPEKRIAVFALFSTPILEPLTAISVLYSAPVSTL